MPLVSSQCPWQQEIQELQTSCLCAYNLGQELSVQCDQVSLTTFIFPFLCFPFNLSWILNFSGRFHYSHWCLRKICKNNSVRFTLHK
jgi:hypothetical protein